MPEDGGKFTLQIIEEVLAKVSSLNDTKVGQSSIKRQMCHRLDWLTEPEKAQSVSQAIHNKVTGRLSVK